MVDDHVRACPLRAGKIFCACSGVDKIIGFPPEPKARTECWPTAARNVGLQVPKLLGQQPGKIAAGAEPSLRFALPARPRI